MMKRLLVAGFLALAPSLAWGQCTGLAVSGAICGNPLASSAPVRLSSLSSFFDGLFGAAKGSIIYRGSSAWVALDPTGYTAGQVLTISGAASAPTLSWTSAGSGTVTSITCNGGLTGGVITTTGTCQLDVANANTWTGVQTFTNATLRLLGAGSGYATLSSGVKGSGNIVVTISGTADQTLASTNLTGQPVTGGAIVTPTSLGTVTSGTLNVNCGLAPLQYLSDNGAFTLSAPSRDGSCILLMFNDSSAGTVTFAGFTVGSSVGATLSTAANYKYSLSIWRVLGIAGYNIFAHQ